MRILITHNDGVYCPGIARTSLAARVQKRETWKKLKFG